MALVLEFLEWQTSWWLDQRYRRQEDDQALASGIAAYAEQQADICRQLATKFTRLWLPFLRSQNITPKWCSRYSTQAGSEETADSTDSDNSHSTDESLCTEDDDSDGSSQ